MTVWSGQGTFNGAGNFSSQVRERNIRASFNGAGNFSAQVKARNIRANFSGAGNFSALVRERNIRARFDGAGNLQCRVPIRAFSAATFIGSSTLSSLDTIIQIQVSFVVHSLLQGIVTDPLAALVGNPKHRLILAAEIDILTLN